MYLNKKQEDELAIYAKALISESDIMINLVNQFLEDIKQK